MRALDAHGKLLTLLCLLLAASAGMLLSGRSLMPAQGADTFAEAFDQIVPGMTRADDLANLGFEGAKADILSHRGIRERLSSAGGETAVRACIRAELYCTGFVFHPGQRSGIAALLDRTSPADIILLVMNGRVIHKAIAARPRAASLG